MKTKCVSNNTNKFTIGNFYHVANVNGQDYVIKDDKGRMRKCLSVHDGAKYRVVFGGDKHAVLEKIDAKSVSFGKDGFTLRDSDGNVRVKVGKIGDGKRKLSREAKEKLTAMAISVFTLACVAAIVLF